MRKSTNCQTFSLSPTKKQASPSISKFFPQITYILYLHPSLSILFTMASSSRSSNFKTMARSSAGPPDYDSFIDGNKLEMVQSVFDKLDLGSRVYLRPSNPKKPKCWVCKAMISTIATDQYLDPPDEYAILPSCDHAVCVNCERLKRATMELRPEQVCFFFCFPLYQFLYLRC